MKLEQLLSGLQYKCLQGSVAGKVGSVCYDTRKLQPESLFVCIKGSTRDSHDLAEDAVKAGAAVLVVERMVQVPPSVTVICVSDSRYALAVLAANFFEKPDRKLTIIGITGTKGKTTTSYFIRSILTNAGHKVGIIGTIGIAIGDEIIPTSNTTPESYVIFEAFRRMVDAGCDTVVMEVSSQALMMKRTAGIQFDYAIFTNIEPDHIGPAEHKDFDEYLYCKSLLFKQCRIGLFNCDDEHFEKITQDAACEIVTFGYKKEASLRAVNTELVSHPGYLGIRFELEGSMNFPVEIDMPGKFNVYNALSAISVCQYLGAGREQICKALKETKVKGRIEMISVSDEFTLMLDYAHNAMSLESLLTTLREYKPKRLVCLFGCGGNRAKSRRYEMGEVSGKLADLTIITSDNPRFEEPQDIVNDIKTGMAKTQGQYLEILDRREAIFYVIHHGEPGDIIVLAGKGHEDYQEIKGVKYPMDERDIIRDILESGE